MHYSNLHTHTCFSDGKADMDAFIRAAQDRDMLSIGFSDHSYTPCDLSYCMKKDSRVDYLRALERAKKEAPLPVYAGLELDADSCEDVTPYDYIIASVHYIKVGSRCWPVDHAPEVQEACIRDSFGGDPIAMVRAYYDTLGDHVARIDPTFVAHFDLPAKFSLLPEETEAYRQTAKAALKEILKLCPYLEINNGAMARGLRAVPYPAPWLLDTVREADGKVILSSDAHRPEHLTYRFDETVSLLREHRIHQIHVFNGKCFDPVSI